MQSIPNSNQKSVNHRPEFQLLVAQDQHYVEYIPPVPVALKSPPISLQLKQHILYTACVTNFKQNTESIQQQVRTPKIINQIARSPPKQPPRQPPKYSPKYYPQQPINYFHKQPIKYFDQPPKQPPKQPIKYFDQPPKKGTKKAVLAIAGVTLVSLTIAAVYYFGFAKNVSLAAQATKSLFTSTSPHIFQKGSTLSKVKSTRCPAGFIWNGKSCISNKHKNRNKNRNQQQKQKQKQREDQTQQQETKEYQPQQLIDFIHRAYDPERPFRLSRSLRHQPSHQQEIMHKSFNML